MIKKIWQDERYRRIISYVFFGGLTTAVNFGVYAIMHYQLTIGKNTSQIIAIISAIVFAYVTNKLFVFRTRTSSPAELLYEIFKFFSARGVSMLVEAGGFYLLVTIAQLNDFLSKIILAAVILVLNYIFSKLVVFKNKSE